MIAEQRLYFPILIFINLHFFWSLKAAVLNSSAGLSTSWINSPSVVVYSESSTLTPILLSRKSNSHFICGFFCNQNSTACLLGILLYQEGSLAENDNLNSPRLVWSANRNHPVKANATLQLGQDGNLILLDSDGTVVWSSNTTGKSVSGLNLTETGNLVLFDKTNRIIWQSFDHPTDTLLPGQTLFPGKKLIASVSESNRSQGLFSFTVFNGNLAAYTDTDPPQSYFSPVRSFLIYSPFYDFDGRTFTHIQNSSRPAAQFMKLEPDGHLRVYQWDGLYWKEVSDEMAYLLGNCMYPLACGRFGICANDRQCACPAEGNFFRPISQRRQDLGCSQLTSILCNSSQYHSLVELKNTGSFAFDHFDPQLSSSVLWFEGKRLEYCKMVCLGNCSCKAVVFKYDGEGDRRGSCLLLNEVFSLIDHEEDGDYTVLLKVQNSSKAQNQSPNISGGKNSSKARNQSPNISGGKKSRLSVIIGSTLSTLLGIMLSIAACFVLHKKRMRSSNAEDILDLAPILPGILTRFSYNDLKIITENFSGKLGEGGFGSVYEGTLSNGTKIAVKRLDGLGQVKDSFLTEVKIVGSIHHINLVKLIGFCAEKSHRLLIYEYMVNGSLDKWICYKKQETGLKWNTRRRIISDVAKGLAYLHDDCSQKIIHLDIKPQNILVDQNFNAKISDFGLSKLIEKDQIEVITRMRGTRGYLAPEWLSSTITEKVDVYAFGIVLLELLCGRKNLDSSRADEDVHLVSVFRRKAEQQQLVDMVDKNNEDMQLHKEEVIEMMSLAAWCLQGDFTKRPSMTLVVKVLEGLVTVETNLDYNFTNLPKHGAGGQQKEATVSARFPSVLSGPR